MKLRVILASSSNLAIPALKALQEDSRIEVIGFISTPDRAKGRHGTPSPNEFASFLQSENLSVAKPEDHTQLLALVAELKPDLVLVIAYGRLIRGDALDAVPRGWINLHFSLLPRYRGAAPVQRSLLAGDAEFGITFFKIDEGMDTGPIILQQETNIEENSMATEILKILSEIGAEQIPELINRIIEGVDPVPQIGEASLAPKIQREELQLEVNSGGLRMVRQIRAFSRRPGCWFIFQGIRCIITQGDLDEVSLPTGSISLQDGRALLGTGDGSILIRSLIPEGRREMSGEAWLRGLRFTDGESRPLVGEVG